MGPGLRGCNPIGFVRERLQKMGDQPRYQRKLPKNSWRYIYHKLVCEISNCRDKTKVLHHFLASQLDYTLFRRGDEKTTEFLHKLSAEQLGLVALLSD
jgi:hypothetical protein